MPKVESRRVMLHRRGVVNLPLHFLAKAGLKPGCKVLVISDGDLVVIKGIYGRSEGGTQIIGRLKGVLRFLTSS